MNIVFAVSAMNSGGAERVVSLLANELCKRGNDVFIVMISTYNCSSFYELDPKIHLINLLEEDNFKIKFFKRVKIFRDRLFAIKPDVVVSFLPHVCIYTYFALKKTSIPFILSERNNPNKYSFFYKVLLKKCFNNASACVFQTNECLNWYKKKNTKPTDKVIFNPVFLTYFPEKNVSVAKKRNVLFVGRFDKQKNYVLLLKSFKLFLEKQNDYVLDVYGDGPEKKRFFKLVTKLNISKNINYHGQSHDWHKAEYDSSVFVSTSRYEGMPNALLEAASLGIPCIATDCPIGGSAEISKVLNNVSLIETNCSPKALSAKIESTIKNEPMFKGIAKEFDLQYITNEWEQLISSILCK